MIAAVFAWAARVASSVWLKIGGFVVGAVVVLSIYSRIRQSGRDAQRADDAIANIKVKERMEDAEAHGPRTRDDVVDRLRKHSF